MPSVPAPCEVPVSEGRGCVQPSRLWLPVLHILLVRFPRLQRVRKPNGRFSQEGHFAARERSKQAQRQEAVSRTLADSEAKQPQLDLQELHEANFLPVAVSLCLSLYYTDLLFFLQCFCLLCIFIECDVSQWDLVTAMLFIFILPLTVHIFLDIPDFFFSPPILPEWFSKRFYIKSHFFYTPLSFLSVSTGL